MKKRIYRVDVRHPYRNDVNIIYVVVGSIHGVMPAVDDWTQEAKQVSSVVVSSPPRPWPVHSIEFVGEVQNT